MKRTCEHCAKLRTNDCKDVVSCVSHGYSEFSSSRIDRRKVDRRQQNRRQQDQRKGKHRRWLSEEITIEEFYYD